MGDSRTAGIEADILHILTQGFKKLKPAVKADRIKLAERIHAIFSGCDFNDDDLGCYDELLVLGLAKKCKVCKAAYTDWNEEDHVKGFCDETEIEMRVVAAEHLCFKCEGPLDHPEDCSDNPANQD